MSDKTKNLETLVTARDIIDIVGIIARKRPLVSYDLFGEFQSEMLKICDKYEQERASILADMGKLRERMNVLSGNNQELTARVALLEAEVTDLKEQLAEAQVGEWQHPSAQDGEVSP